jgi:hypothetical protein
VPGKPPGVTAALLAPRLVVQVGAPWPRLALGHWPCPVGGRAFGACCFAGQASQPCRSRLGSAVQGRTSTLSSTRATRVPSLPADGVFPLVLPSWGQSAAQPATCATCGEHSAQAPMVRDYLK